MDDYEKTLLLGAKGLLILNIFCLIVIAICKPQVYCSKTLGILFIIFVSSIFMYLDLLDCIKKEIAIPFKIAFGIPFSYIISAGMYLIILVSKGVG